VRHTELLTPPRICSQTPALARGLPIACLLLLASWGCDKKESEPRGVPAPTKKVADSQSARRVLDLAEAKAFAKAEAAFQAVVEKGPPETFLERGRALATAGKTLAEKIPNEAYETTLPDRLHQALGMLEAIDARMAENAEVRKRLGGTIHRNLAAAFALDPLPYEPITTVEMSMTRFCSVLSAGLAQATVECGKKATMPPCCDGAACDQPLTFDLEKIELCNQKVVGAACAGKLDALPPECARAALLK